MKSLVSVPKLRSCSKAEVGKGLEEVLIVPGLRSGKKVPPSPYDPAGLLHNCSKPA